MLGLRLNQTTDADIIEALANVPNKSKRAKELIRKGIQAERSVKKTEKESTIKWRIPS